MERQNNGQLYNAMMQATKGSFKSICARKVCDLLVSLKKSGVATNEVEFGVQKSCYMLSKKRRSEIKMEIMRRKISDAFREMTMRRIESAKIWRDTKKVITGEVRVKYLNKWRDSVNKLKQDLISKNQAKVEWLKKKWKELEEKIDDEKVVSKCIEILMRHLVYSLSTKKVPCQILIVNDSCNRVMIYAFLYDS